MSKALVQSRGTRAALCAAGVLAAMLWVGTAVAAPEVVRVEVRAARHDGFGRLVLDWPEPTPVRTERIEDGLRIRAPSSFRADFAEARRLLSPWLSAIGHARDESVLTLRFEPGVRADRLDYAPDLLVLDLREARPRSPPAASMPYPEVRVGRHDGFTRLVLDWATPVAPRIESGPHHLAIVLDRPFALDLAALRGRLEGLVDVVERPGPRQLRLRLAPNVAADPFTLDDDKLVLDLHPSADATPPGAGRTDEAGTTSLGAREPGGDRSPSALATPLAAETLRIDASRLEDGFELGFAWPEPVPAAIFVRGSTLWTVFDALPARVPREPLRWEVDALARVLGPSERLPLEGALALRFPLKVPTRVHVERDGSTWRVRLGPTAAPVPEVAVHPAGPQGIAVHRADAGELVELVDPEVGDRLGIWPLGKPGGVPDGRRLVHVDVLPSAQGIVWSRRSDRLGVLAGTDELLLAPATRLGEPEPRRKILEAGWRGASEGGDDAAAAATHAPAGDKETLPPAPAVRHAHPRPPPAKPERQTATRVRADAKGAAAKREDTDASPTTRAAPPADASSVASGSDPSASTRPPPGPVLDLAGFGPAPGVGLAERRAEAMARAARAPEEGRRAAQLDLARMLLAHGLAAEAMGVLIDTGPGEKDGAADDQRALKGAAAFLMHRLDQAAEALDDSAFDGDNEVALWRAATAGGRGDWERATAILKAAGDTLASYPLALRLPLGLAVAKIEAHAGHSVNASSVLEQLRRAPLPAAQRRRVAFTQGEVYAAVGAIDAAAQTWRALEDGTRDRTALEAGLAWRRLLVEADRLDPEEALRALLPLRAAWRGHPSEARQLDTLARLHARTERVAEAIRLWQEALARGADAALADSIETAKRRALVKALEHGGDDWVGPLRAYGLFQDFRQLVPTGEEGVRVRRRLAERLASIDQLDPAGEVLLEALAMSPPGPDRGALGAELAELWLRYPDPGRALDALRSSHAADLPADVRRRRALLSARAKRALREYTAALAALVGLEDLETRRLRAGILFEAGRWNAFERTVRPLLEAEEGISPGEQRTWLLRLAIALREAGDRAELAELRRGSAARLAGTSEETRFRLATAVSEPESPSPASAIDAAARQIAAARRYLETF